jgi:hypothetical protein
MMQIQPLVKVKKAANLLGVDKNELTRRLTAGEIKGECKTIGDKQKWFIYSGELDSLLIKERFPEVHAARVSMDGLGEIFETAETDKGPESTELVETPAADESQEVPSAPQDTLAEPVPPEEKAPVRRRAGTRRGKPAVPETMYISNVVDVENLDFTPPAMSAHAPVHIDRYEAPNTVTVDAYAGASFETVIHSLSIEFAYRLAEERQKVFQLEARLAEQGNAIEQLAPLQNALQIEVRNGCMKDLQIKSLQADLAALQEKAQKARPWWKRMLALFTGEKPA